MFTTVPVIGTAWSDARQDGHVSDVVQHAACFKASPNRRATLCSHAMTFVPLVRETHLSRGPARGSFPIAAASVALLFTGSLAYWMDPFGVARFLPASRESVFAEGEYWRLLTALAAHADFQHFLANGIVFGLLAFLLHGYYGRLVFPVLSVASAALVTAIGLRTYPPHTLLVGASGAIYWMAGFWIVLYLFIERRFDPAKRILRAVGFGFILLVPTVIEPEVSYRTHAIGFALGVVFGVFYFSRRKEALRAAEVVELG